MLSRVHIGIRTGGRWRRMRRVRWIRRLRCRCGRRLGEGGSAERRGSVPRERELRWLPWVHRARLVGSVCPTQSHVPEIFMRAWFRVSGKGRAFEVASGGLIKNQNKDADARWDTESRLNDVMIVGFEEVGKMPALNTGRHNKFCALFSPGLSGEDGLDHPTCRFGSANWPAPNGPSLLGRRMPWA